jgi:hypothetical protein
VSISKAQLDAINRGALANIGKNANDPDLKAGSLLDELLIGVATKLTKELYDKLTEKQTVATKNLRQSIDASGVYKISNGVALDIKMADYWPFVDKGRRKGKRPPVIALEEWIRNKASVKQSVKPKDGQSIDDAIKSFAIAISRKIGSKGTIKRFGYKGANFIEEVLSPQNIDAIAQHLSDAFGQRILISVKMEEVTPTK